MEHRTDIRPDPWTHALESLQKGRHTVLVKVVDHSGSVPGVTGTMVTVSDLGIAGTIGGGAAEKELVEHALAHEEGSKIIRFRHTPGEGGTLCSGLQVFAVMALTPDDQADLENIVSALGDHRNGYLHISPDGLDFQAGIMGEVAFNENEVTWQYREPLGLLDTLTIVGGGHVSLALSKVMATLPFRMLLLDDRPDLPTMVANTHVHEKRVLDYAQVAEHVPEGDRSWVVIMTYGHVHDRRVLEELIGPTYAYLGVLGSRAKIHQMFANMKADGVSADSLDRVHAPIGLDIGSHTPEEIAISIAGQIVAIRNGKDA